MVKEVPNWVSISVTIMFEPLATLRADAKRANIGLDVGFSGF
jgi:hypothetical protein